MPDDSARDLQDAAERRSFSSAREHVGAAGFAQRDALERLISAGQEQIQFTLSLSDVMSTTLAQLHALPLADLHDAAGPHVTALENIVRSASAQLDTADRLRAAIQDALNEVRGTPVEHVSAQLLTNLSQVVYRQEADLQALIALALNEASTVGHITTLEQVSVNAQTRLLTVERQRAEQELLELHQSGQRALERIRALEEGGVTHAEQKAQLEQEASAAQLHIEGLEAGAARDGQEIIRMERENAALRAHTAELEAAALKTQEKIARLRLDLERVRQANDAEARRQGTSGDPPLTN